MDYWQATVDVPTEKVSIVAPVIRTQDIEVVGSHGTEQKMKAMKKIKYRLVGAEAMMDKEQRGSKGDERSWPPQLFLRF